MRLFAAVYPPAEVLEAIERATSSVAGSAGSARPVLSWVPRDLLHITLAFYGDVPPGALSELTQNLGVVARSSPVMELTVRGAGVFSERVLWLGVGGDAEPLRVLSSRAAEAGADAGLRLDRRPRHRAHLTVARVRGSAAGAHHARGRRGERGREELSQALTYPASALAVYVGPTWQAREFTLVESDLSGGRPVHRILERFALGGDGAV